MEAKELMIGDWVNIKGCEIAQIRDLKDLLNVELGIFVASGVPLTEEILKANGFEDETADFWKLRVDDKPHHYNFRLNKGGVFGGDGYNMNCNIYTITIKYVHQLQHALRLCGLTDMADNFKIS